MKRYLSLAMTFLLHGVVSGGGPVYVNKAGEGGAVVEGSTEAAALVTQTVYGFLDFTTTIANTVMVFSPQSQPALEIIPTKVETTSVVSRTTAPPPVLSSRVEVREGPPVKPDLKEGKGKEEKKQLVAGPTEKGKPGEKAGASKQPKQEAAPKPKPTAAAAPPAPEQPAPTTPKQPAPTTAPNKQPAPTTPKQPAPTTAPKQPAPTTPKQPPPAAKQPQKAASKPEPVKVKPSPTIKAPPKIATSQEPAFVFENNLEQAEYDFLSRQPSEVVDETYKVVEVGKGGRVSGGRLHEESLEEGGLPLESLFSVGGGPGHPRPSRRPALPGGPPPPKNRIHRTRPPSEPPLEPTKRVTNRPSFKLSHSRFGRPSSSLDPVPTLEVGPSSSRRYQRLRTGGGGSSGSNTIETGGGSGVGQSRRFKPRPSPASTAHPPHHSSTSLYKFKLSRPQGRWQYKTSPKPRIAIRRQDEEGGGGPQVAPSPATPALPDTLEESEMRTQDESLQPTANLASTPTPTLPIQTLRVDISTPADFSDLYYEIAIIKSPYTFQVGTVKNTRYITVTSTFEKLLIDPTETSSSTEPLTENILTTKPAFDKEASIATLPPIAIAGEETLPLETTTEFLSTSEILLKTHLLPVVRDSNTTTLTLVQTYEVTKLVTATKTLPPTELFQFIPSKTLNEFNTKLDEAGSELHLELEFGDSNNEDEPPSAARTLPEFNNITTEDPVTVSVNTPHPLIQEQLSPEKLQQLAFLRLLNPNQPPVITSTPILSIQTLYETHVIPVYNGQSTILSTISRSVGTVTNTQYKTSTVPLPSLPLPLFPTPQLQAQFTSTPIVTQTVVTETNSKVLKLTFGAKTAYTTLYSTKVVPTLLTTYLTAQLPVQQTAPAFAPFFPPFNPFSFVG